MRKLPIFTLILDSLFFIGALINLLAGDASAADYVVLYFSISILVGEIISRICKAKRSND